MILTKTKTTSIIFLFGFIIMASNRSVTFCEALKKPTSFVKKQNGKGQSILIYNTNTGGIVDKNQPTPPPFPPPDGVGDATAKVLSADIAGGARAPLQNQNNQPKWIETIPWYILWFAANALYGFCTKNILSGLYYPWTVATMQLATSMACVILLWYNKGRKVPSLTWNDIVALLPAAICHIGVHVAATIATGIPSGLALAHTIKALEPMVTYGFDFAAFGRVLPIEAFIGIVPIIAGSILPYVKNQKFELSSTLAALAIVLFASVRVVLCKKIVSEKRIGENLDAKNLYAVLSIMTGIILFPIMYWIDGFDFFYALQEKFIREDVWAISVALFVSGLAYYLYNEASFVVLDKINPVSHSIAGLMRRPAIMLVSAFTYAMPVGRDSIIGSLICAMGAMIYRKEMCEYYEDREEGIVESWFSPTKKGNIPEKTDRRKYELAQ